MDVLNDGMVERLKKAIETVLSPFSTQQDRKSAHELIEAFKNESPHSASIGLTLYANYENSIEVRYIGLQLVEDYIKNRWNNLSQEEKDTWKKEAMFLMAAIKPSEGNQVKEALVQITVEIAKREFPQNWGKFLPELWNLQTKGPTQLEVTLLVFLRLAEDVIFSLDSHIHTQRRRNIEQALSENMKEIFNFFITTLQENVGAWRNSQEQIKLRLAEATLFTLLAYLGHAGMEHVFAPDSVLLQMICQLLNEEKLRVAAADCLLVLVERKRDRVDVRSPILILFSDGAMNLFVEVARKSCLAGADEDEYNFLKKICDVIVSLGSCQLADIWGHDRGIHERPATFERYMKLILDMVSHPSQVISHKALSVYLAFLRHEHISKDDVFIESIPFFLNAFGEKLPKVGELNEDNHPSCKYSLMDHDSTNEFMDLFGRLRSALSFCIRESTDILPIHCFEHVCRKILELAQKEESPEGALYWDAVATFADAMFTRFWRAEKIASDTVIERGKSVNIVAVSNEILRSLIQLQSKIPQVASNVLICIQAFFPFFERSQENLIATLEKIMATFSQFPLQESSKDFLSARRQATSSFLHLCKQDSAHLLPYFDSFKQYVSKLEENKEITILEYYTLLEGLLVLSNSMPAHREDFILTQLSRLDEIMGKDAFKISLESTDDFIKFIGLAGRDWSDTQSRENRQYLSSFLSLLLAIVRRVQLTEAEKSNSLSGGGFFGTAGSSWIQKLVAYLPVLTQIIKHAGIMWTPEMQEKISKRLLPAFGLNENDRAFLLGQHVAKDIKETLTLSSAVANKASVFIHNLHSQSYSLLGQFGGFLGEYFYNVDGLTELLISNVMSTWAFLPKYRFVTVFKSFFKPFLLSCPANCFVTIIPPFLSVALESMLTLLTKEWTAYNERITKNGNKDQSNVEADNTSNQVIEERSIYTLSREYTDTLVSCFFVKSKEKDQSIKEEDIANPDPGDLGNFILQCEATNSNYIFTMFNALTWPDTSAVNKIVRVIPHIIKFISQQISGCKIDSLIIDQLFLCILKGLQTHGADLSPQGSLITAALNMYMHLRVAYPSLVQIMLMVPSCKKEKLMKFDLDVFESECKLTDKKKRECFRIFLSDAFGKNLSEIHKADIRIKDLPPLAPRVKPKPLKDDDISNLTGLFR